MKLFDFDKTNKLLLLPEVINIPEFKDVYDRDESKSKYKAYSEFCYIYYVHSYASPYSNITNIDQRKIAVAKEEPKTTVGIV